MVQSLEPRFAILEPHAEVLMIELRQLPFVVRAPWPATEGRGPRWVARVSHAAPPAIRRPPRTWT